MYNGKLREVHYSHFARIWYIEVNGKKITVDANGEVVNLKNL